jgi:hypothetical protein
MGEHRPRRGPERMRRQAGTVLERGGHRARPTAIAARAEFSRAAHAQGAIGRQLGMPVSTVSGILRRLGLGKLATLEPKPPIMRYQRARPGELLHIDIKKLGRIAAVGHRIAGDRRDRQRGAGWEYVHVCIDDASPTSARTVRCRSSNARSPGSRVTV